MQYDLIKNILQVFGSTPKNVLVYYAARWLNITESKADFVVTSMAQQRHFYYDKELQWCYLYQGCPQNYSAPFALNIIDKLGGGKEFRVAKAIYPLDYIFEAEHILYQIIDCFNEGIYKLNFRKHMLETNENMGKNITPILMMRNKPLREIDKNLYPEGEFYFATAEFDINNLTEITTKFIKGREA